MDQVIERNVKFNQKHLLQNIFAVIEQKGLKIGEVEKASGLSVGYLSRLAKAEKSFPTVETVWSIARTLGVSLEWLIEGNAERITSQAEYLSQFISRLFDQTQEGRLDWGRYTIWDIDTMLAEGAPQGFPAIAEGKCTLSPETLLGVDPATVSRVTDTAHTRRICPVTRHDAAAAIAGSCFYADISPETRLFLIRYMERMVVSREEDGTVNCDYVHWFELLSVSRRDFSVLPVCNTLAESDILAPALRKLYSDLQLHEQDVRVNPSVRSLIDDFMERTAPTT